MIQSALIYLYVCLLSLTLHTGVATNFGPHDSGNPNPHLACVSGIVVHPSMPVVAHRTLPCGEEILICTPRTQKCTKAIVADRLGNHCKTFSRGKCVEYWSDLDMTTYVQDSMKHNGNERVIFIYLRVTEEKRKANLQKLAKKWYLRTNS